MSFLIALLGVAIAATGFVAVRYVFRVYLSEDVAEGQPRSRFMRLLTTIVVMIEAFCLSVMPFTVARLFGLDPTAGASPAILLAGLIAILVIPHMVAVFVYRTRHPEVSVRDALVAVLSGQADAR